MGEIQQIPLKPLREMRKLTGTLQQLMEDGQMREAYGKDYIQAILTDEGELFDPIGCLRSAYPNVMQIIRAEALKKAEEAGAESAGKRLLAEKKDMLSLFLDFYKEVRGEEPGEEKQRILAELIKEMEE